MVQQKMTTGPLLLGTRNPARIRMIQQAVTGWPLVVITLEDAGILQQVEESGASTQENASEKARQYFKLSGLPTLAIDGGLEIDQFPPEKQPGVLVRRIPGRMLDPTEAEVLEYYIQELKVAGGRAQGTWTGSLALALPPNGELIQETFTFVTWLVAQPYGNVQPGLALDPIMIDPVTGKYYTELPEEERPYYKKMVEFLRRYCL